HFESGERGHRREELADVRGADDDQARRTRVGAHEEVFSPGQGAALVGDEHPPHGRALALGERKLAFPALAVEERLRAVLEARHYGSGGARRGRLAQPLVGGLLHSTRSTKTRTFPPHASPTSHAC